MTSIEAVIALSELLPMPSEDTIEYGNAFVNCMNRIIQFTFFNPDFVEDFDMSFFTSASEEKIAFWYNYFSEWEEDIDTILEYLDDLDGKP